MAKKKVKISRNCNVNWENDQIQFPRLISELEAAGVFMIPKVVDSVCDSMSIELNELDEMIDRAQSVWDDIKARTRRTHE